MTSSSNRVLIGTPSLFLDNLRLIAALIVLLAHAQRVWFGGSFIDSFFSHLSHGAVVVFFVLSGFVIAHTTSNKNRGFIQYAVARLSRLYSIFFPALILTILCSIIVYNIDYNLFSNYNRGNSILRYTLSLFFSNEIWFFSSAPLINGPIWSLSYEFWFYVIYGCYIYKPNGWKGYLLLLLVSLIAGPKILLMMLIWFIGIIAYKFPKPTISSRTAWISISFLIMISFFLMIHLPSWPFEMGTPPLFWASQFITDVLIGLFIGLAFWILPNGKTNGLALPRRVVLFRKISDLTFPIYVCHFPFLILFKALFNLKEYKLLEFSLGLICTIVACSLVGLYLESKRTNWSKLFEKISTYIDLKLKSSALFLKNA